MAKTRLLTYMNPKTAIGHIREYNPERQLTEEVSNCRENPIRLRITQKVRGNCRLRRR